MPGVCQLDAWISPNFLCCLKVPESGCFRAGANSHCVDVCLSCWQKSQDLGRGDDLKCALCSFYCGEAFQASCLKLPEMILFPGYSCCVKAVGCLFAG